MGNSKELGCFFLLSNEPTVGSTIEVEITVPPEMKGIAPGRLLCQCKVVRVDEKNGNGRTGRLICAWLMLQNGYSFLSPLLESRWGGNKDHRVKIFQNENNNYTACLRNPEILNLHFSEFYLYFLHEILDMLK